MATFRVLLVLKKPIQNIPPKPVPPTVWPVSTVCDYTFSIVFVTKYHNSTSRSFLYEAFGFYFGPVFTWQFICATGKLLEHLAPQTTVGAGPQTDAAWLQHNKPPS